MKRDMYRKLLEWKHSQNRKPLILKGARQVGKTYILKEFGKSEYDNCAYFNFEEDPTLNDFFDGRLEPGKIIERLSLYYNIHILPGETLIIFDEVQNSPRTLTALKYFQENAGSYHVVAAGSLLGLKVGHGAAFPVGKVQFMNLYPLSYFEYLDAAGKSRLRQFLEEKNDFEPLPSPFHEELLDHLKMYYYTGGMPEPVKCYLEDNDPLAVRRVQENILSSYQGDFAKHAGHAEAVRIAGTWQTIPLLLARENKKFKYSEISRNARSRDYYQAVQWLVDAGLVYKCYNIKIPKLPLSGYKEDHMFKLYLLDVGLLGAMLNLSTRTIVEGNQLFAGYNGAFTENYAAQELLASPFYESMHFKELYYWSSENRAEVDFIVQAGENIYPLEVKTGFSRRKTSLVFFGEKYDLPLLSRVTAMNFKEEKNIRNYPLYALRSFTAGALEHRGAGAL